MGEHLVCLLEIAPKSELEHVKIFGNGSDTISDVTNHLTRLY